MTTGFWPAQSGIFDAAAEPLAAAAEACRTDPFVMNLSCELERDVLRIAEMLGLESWSVSLELCPETFAKCKATRLHVHFAIALSAQAKVEREATLRLAGGRSGARQAGWATTVCTRTELLAAALVPADAQAGRRVVPDDPPPPSKRFP